MDVFLANEQELPVNETRLTSLAHHVLAAEGVDDEAELSVLFVTADHIRQLNARFAGDDYATDVLAFPMSEDEDEPVILGDVVISPNIARRNATKLSHTLEHELDVLLVHGTLHLLGYDHHSQEDKAKMDKRSAELLESFKAIAAT